jgi:hypothetical protein
MLASFPFCTPASDVWDSYPADPGAQSEHSSNDPARTDQSEKKTRQQVLPPAAES